MAPATFSTIYWPFETKFRELDGCLLFSVIAAQRGWSVVFGGKTELYRRLRQNAEPGILIDKSIQKGSEHLFGLFKKRGHRVSARCEEGLTFLTPEDYCNRKTGRAAFQEVQDFLAWGNNHARALADVYPEFALKVLATGNVRFDLLRPAVRGVHERDVSRIRERWGDFFLLNTKFAKMNHIKRGGGLIENHIRLGHAPNQKQVQLLTKGLAREQAALPHVVEFIERFSKELPDETLIIRPHPAEVFSLWEGVAEGKQNVHVVHEGNVHPWLLASKLSIASDCMTSVEAYLLDKPGINFRPIQDDEAELVLPRAAAYQVRTTDALLAALASEDPRSELSLPDSCAETMRHYIAQCGGPLASEAILDHFADLYAPRSGEDGQTYNPLGKVNRLFVAKQKLKVFLAWCASRDNRARYRNRAQKFRGIEQNEVATRLDDICGTLGAEGICVTKLAKSLFHIHADE